MPPRSQALAPGTVASRDATSPAVTPSAVARVRRRGFNRAATTSCKSSFSTPNTKSPRRARMVDSTGSIWACASAGVAAWARMRREIAASLTVMPTSGTWPRRVRSSSFSSMVGLAGAEDVDLALHQHAAAHAQSEQPRPHLLFVHYVHFRGHTGHGADIAAPRRIQTPGAVPHSFGSASAPAGIMAWTRLRSGMVRFRRRNMPSIWSYNS